MKKRIAAIAALVVTLALTLTACPSGAGNGGGDNPVGGPQSQAKVSCAPGDNNYSWCSNNPDNPQPTEPIATADARSKTGEDSGPPPEEGNQPLPSIPFHECVLNLDPEGTGLRLWDNGIHIRGIFHVVCARQPTSMIVVARLTRRSGGNWLDEADILADAHLPGLVTSSGRYSTLYKRDYSLEALCYPGSWRLEVQWHGIKADGKSVFGSQIATVPADIFYTDCMV